jgi:hypothetical protein
VRLFKNVFFLAASLLSVFTLAVSIVGGAATISASGSASAAEADYILQDTKLQDLSEEEREIASRMMEIPGEQGDAWGLCTNVILDGVFGSGSTAADEAGCEEWRQLEKEKETLAAREQAIPQQVKVTRDKRNTAQVESLAAGRQFNTTLSFTLAGTALLAFASIGLWIFGARSSVKNRDRN